MKLFKLYDNISDFQSDNARVEGVLGIPSGGTTHYASGDRVDNPESADYGKYILPVFTSGKYKCDSLFDSSSLVGWGDWTEPI